MAAGGEPRGHRGWNRRVVFLRPGPLRDLPRLSLACADRVGLSGMRHPAGRASIDAWESGRGVALEPIGGGAAAGGLLARFAGIGPAGFWDQMARAGDAALFWVGAGGDCGGFWHRSQSAGVSHLA